jgi:hypothetical protein
VNPPQPANLVEPSTPKILKLFPQEAGDNR